MLGNRENISKLFSDSVQYKEDKFASRNLSWHYTQNSREARF